MKKAILTTASDTLHVVLEEPSKHANSTIGYLIWLIGAIIIALLVLLNWHKLKRIFSFIRLKEYKLSIAGFELSGKLEYNAAAQDAAWKIYVELATRVSGNELAAGTGILRESLNSLYTAFSSLRDTLKAAGPELAKPPSSERQWTVATLLLNIMNEHLRPFLSKWHPLLQEYEKSRPASIATFTHEKQWSENTALREELAGLMTGLKSYISALKDIAEGKTG
jgi:hypothetical protein